MQSIDFVFQDLVKILIRVFLPTQFAHGGVEAVEGEGEHAVIENLFDDVG